MSVARSCVIANGKGGVGKTSIACNIAGLAAEAGLATLLVEFDPQGNAARDLGFEQDDGSAMLNALVSGADLPVRKAVRPRLDVVPCGPEAGDITGLVLMRSSRGGASLASTFESVLSRIASDYDLILIDTPPGEKVLVEAAMGVASTVLIPTRSDDASLDGLERVAERFVAAREVNPDLALAGIVLFGIGSRSRRLNRIVRDAIAQVIGEAAPVFDATIRYLESAAVDTRRGGLLAHELETASEDDRKARLAALRAGRTPDSELLVRNATGVASDYESLTRELLARIAELERQEEPA